jgi:hypothetical protein
MAHGNAIMDCCGKSRRDGVNFLSESKIFFRRRTAHNISAMAAFRFYTIFYVQGGNAPP